MENIKEKMTKNKKIMIIGLIAIILIVLAFVSIKYVTTSIDLASDKLSSSSNAIGISSVEIEKSDVADATYTINDGGASVSFTATLGVIGDYVRYVIKVQNNNCGPAALIDSVEIIGGDNPALNYSTDAKGTIIEKGTTETVEFKITYISTEEEIPDSTEITVNFKFAKYGFTYGDAAIYPLTSPQQNGKVAGLYPDSTESGRYYYSGSAVNNAIVFNGDPYRILAFEPDGRIKIMKMVSIGTQKWHTSKTNVWSSSSLKQYLEGTWLPTQESGEDYQYLTHNNDWYVGTVSGSPTIETAYTAEKKTIVNSAIGLISVSEFLKSKYTGSTFLDYSSNWWTISPFAGDSSVAWHVSSNSLSISYGGDGYVTFAFQIFPVLYLESSVSLTGSGTATDPYCVVGSACPTDLTFTQRAS